MDDSQIRRYDKALLLVFLIGLYFYFQRLATIPRSRPFSEEEDDAFAAEIDARRKSKVKLSEKDCMKFSLNELSDLEKNGVVILP